MEGGIPQETVYIYIYIFFFFLHENNLALQLSY